MKEIIIKVIVTVLVIVLGYFVSYLKTKSNIVQRVANFIDKAEEIYKDYAKAGSKKFTWCVDNIYSLIPNVFKPILTKELLGVIVQNVFDSMQEFANKQLDKLIDNKE